MLAGVSVAPFIPFTGGASLYAWMSQYTMDTIGGARTGYVMTYLLCWILCALPWVAWMIIEQIRSPVRAPTHPEEKKPPKPSRTPTLSDLRSSFRVGMSTDEFYAECDSMLERFGGLRMGTPIASENLISIHVAEGDAVLFFLGDERLTYAEYRGGVFLGE